MKYQRRSLEVEAVQWTAHNLDEVRAICPNANVIDSGWTLTIPVAEDHRIAGICDYLVAHVGHYVVHIKGLWVPMTEAAFKDTYEDVQA